MLFDEIGYCQEEWWICFVLFKHYTFSAFLMQNGHFSLVIVLFKYYTFSAFLVQNAHFSLVVFVPNFFLLALVKYRQINQEFDYSMWRVYMGYQSKGLYLLIWQILCGILIPSLTDKVFKITEKVSPSWRNGFMDTWLHPLMHLEPHITYSMLLCNEGILLNAEFCFHGRGILYSYPFHIKSKSSPMMKISSFFLFFSMERKTLKG